MKILLTGITGYIGSCFADYATAKGHTVGGVVRRSISKLPYAMYHYDGTFQSLERAVDEFSPDVVINLAASYGEIESIVESNIKFPTLLCEAAKGSAKVFISAGSYWQFGSGEYSAPLDMYSVSKTAFESVAEFYAAEGYFRACILYLYGTYGEGDSRGKVLDHIIQSVRAGREVNLSPGEQILNLVHVSDVAQAITMAAEQLLRGVGRTFERYAVYSEHEYSLRSLAMKCKEQSDGAKIRIGALPYRERELMRPVYPYPSVPDWVEQFDVDTYIREELSDGVL
ncbi:paratose synthase [Stutzerimonas stutzeri]|uniref:NAD-dependent epimerase/dehydratase family protein n=1 Tax=Stutzerimonas stutzeri TaxID=316 RepID=UPI0024A178A1|nr:NAD-dependent epimerase/dehydratase family protein [Stutzerimonas stutzeri]GLZ26256.1 paratose synthase [Stutzerimonas stutzeri]